MSLSLSASFALLCVLALAIGPSCVTPQAHERGDEQNVGAPGQGPEVHSRVGAEHGGQGVQNARERVQTALIASHQVLDGSNGEESGPVVCGADAGQPQGSPRLVLNLLFRSAVKVEVHHGGQAVVKCDLPADPEASAFPVAEHAAARIRDHCEFAKPWFQGPGVYEFRLATGPLPALTPGAGASEDGEAGAKTETGWSKQVESVELAGDEDSVVVFGGTVTVRHRTSELCMEPRWGLRGDDDMNYPEYSLINAGTRDFRFHDPIVGHAQVEGQIAQDADVWLWWIVPACGDNHGVPWLTAGETTRVYPVGALLGRWELPPQRYRVVVPVYDKSQCEGAGGKCAGKRLVVGGEFRVIGEPIAYE